MNQRALSTNDLSAGGGLAVSVVADDVVDIPHAGVVFARFPAEMEGPDAPPPPALAVDLQAVEAAVEELQDGQRAEAEPAQVMVAWMLDDPEAGKRLLLVSGDGVEPTAPDDMHVTLAYLGRVGVDVDEDAVEGLTDLLRSALGEMDPLEGSIGGSITFPGSAHSDGRTVHAAAVDVPGLEVLRAAVVAACVDAGLTVRADHGWVPHLTLAYAEPGATALHVDMDVQVPARIRSVDVVVGGVRTGIPIGQPTKAPAFVGAVGREAEIDAAVRKLDDDPGALRGQVMRSSAWSSTRKATAKEMDKAKGLMAERFGAGGGVGHTALIRVTSSKRARDGHTIAPRGWHFDDWHSNPVVLWQHNRDKLPVGRGVVVAVDDEGVDVVDEFVSREMDPFGGTVGDMVDGGFLHSPSIGWDTIRAVRVKDPALVDRYGYPLDILEANKLEHSIVTVPADVYTGVVRARAAGLNVAAFADRFGRAADEETNARLRDSFGRIALAAGPNRTIVQPAQTKETPVKTEPAKTTTPIVPTQHRAAGGLRCPSCNGPVRAPDAPDPAMITTQAPNPGSGKSHVDAGVGERTKLRGFDHLTPEVQGALEVLAQALSAGGGAPPPPAPGSMAAAAPPPPANAVPPPPAAGQPPAAGDSNKNPEEDAPDVKAARAELFGNKRA